MMINDPICRPPKAVMAVIDSYPRVVRTRLLTLRRLIHEAAAAHDAGPLTETLKWGEIAFLTEASRSGTTVRLAWKPAAPDRYGVYLNCKTSLVEQFRALFGGDLTFEGNRAILLPIDGPVPEDILRACFGMALTYHRRKRVR
jgi:Domain of unknown function (DU1801)